MTELVEDKIVDADYAFRFDALPEPVTFSRQIKITGWLLHRQGLPIHGIRGIVRGFLRRRSIFKARRKRSRPLIAAAYPDLPEAGQKQILKEYKDYTVKKIVFFDDNENNDTNMVLYNSQFDGEDNYFVELQKDDKTIVVQVTPDGLTGYFTSL